MVGIIDYSVGNLGSIKNMVKYVGGEAKIVEKPDDFIDCDRVILPGVGAFDKGIKSLRNSGLLEKLEYLTLEKKMPTLGICLGAQLMTLNSSEGVENGLGWLNAETVKFNLNSTEYKLPHMGWNEIKTIGKHPIFDGLDNESRFYFVHSYFMQSNDTQQILARTKFGIEFDSGLCDKNIVALQFHPEKSHKFGMKVISNFLNWNPK